MELAADRYPSPPLKLRPECLRLPLTASKLDRKMVMCSKRSDLGSGGRKSLPYQIRPQFSDKYLYITSQQCIASMTANQNEYETVM